LLAVLIAALTLFLVACGGGGSSGGATAGAPLTPAPAPAPQEPAPAPAPAPQEPAPAPAPSAAGDYTLFESGQVRPLALSPDGRRLFAVNTPDNRLEIFDVTAGGLAAAGSVPVGLEPVAVAAASATEAWVVNHLSDSVSIVRLDGGVPRVARTLWVGDEPRDIILAGPGHRRAFVTAAHRGQNHPDFSPQHLKRPGIGRADVWVFDVDDPGTAAGGKPLYIVNLFADTPRALAASADGSRVYAAAFLSGNQTTTLLNEPAVADAKPAPRENVENIPQPATGLIVGFDGARWVDETGRDWSARVMFDLPDLDVFTLDAGAEEPRILESRSGVGTVLFNLAVNPASGAVYASNTDARNRVRFEGPGEGATTVRGHIAENRISVLRGDQLRINRLNPHVDFSLPEGEAIPAPMKAMSLAQPMGMAVSGDGQWLYLAAFGSNRIAVIATADLEAGRYDPRKTRHIRIPGGGPTGVVLSPDGTTLYTVSRYDNAVSAIDLETDAVIATRTMHSPESGAIRRGRRLLYDAELTSSNGTASCGSCHIFGDVDGLAWDLGNPDGVMVDNPNEFVPLRNPTQGVFHPMKGPMTTQTFRGIADSGPMHWRGDRTGQDRAVVRGELESLEAAAFKEFNPAFVGLLGRESELAADQLQDFTDFALAIVPPPNAIRALDNSLTPDQAEGRRVFLEERTTGGVLTCDHCHVLDEGARHFGTAGLMTNEGPGITEDFKVVHLRNVYTKVGMFGESVPRPGQQAVHMGDQVRGFGLLHDGGIDTVSNFLASSVFGFASADQREQVVDFVFAFPGNLAPVVGQQVTIGADPDPVAVARLELLIARAAVGGSRTECDLVVKGVIDGEPRGALRRGDGRFRTDRTADGAVTLEQLRNVAARPGQELTFTCVPPGSGQRIGLDRDRDGVLDGD
jgi:YVTN family beta-propeller protein